MCKGALSSWRMSPTAIAVLFEYNLFSFTTQSLRMKYKEKINIINNISNNKNNSELVTTVTCMSLTNKTR